MQIIWVCMTADEEATEKRTDEEGDMHCVIRRFIGVSEEQLNLRGLDMIPPLRSRSYLWGSYYLM